jgi:hypothetical protein
MSQVFLKILVGCSVAFAVPWCSEALAQKAVTQKDVDEAATRVKLTFCESFASLMQTLAVERDKGTPLSDLYPRLPDSEYFPREKSLEAAKLIYAHPEESPSEIKHIMLDSCYKTMH